jgi:hypothetical protein
VVHFVVRNIFLCRQIASEYSLPIVSNAFLCPDHQLEGHYVKASVSLSVSVNISFPSIIRQNAWVDLSDFSVGLIGVD